MKFIETIGVGYIIGDTYIQGLDTHIIYTIVGR